MISSDSFWDTTPKSRLEGCSPAREHCMPELWIDSDTSVLQGSRAMANHEKLDDVRYIKDDAVLVVPRARWHLAQQYEKKHG